jgi:primosomal protein N' (replication factor Y)
MNTEKKIIQVALATPLRQHFDYLPPEQDNGLCPEIGTRVLVPFGRQKIIGIVIGFDQHSDIAPDKLKPIFEILDEAPLLDTSIIALCEWASRYYQHPLGEILHAALPALARKPGGFNSNTLTCSDNKETISIQVDQDEIELNDAQKFAVETINRESSFSCFLLNGITGSGKTEVYLRTIAQRLQQGQQAIVLVPEIGLTPQTIQRFTARFNVPTIALHSKLSEKKRLHAWLEAKAGRAKIIIGTRSAILCPAPDLGIIILDEEHDPSFKQQSRFRYSARDLAIMRCKFLNIPIIIGSATPSLESLYNVSQKRFTELRLPERAGLASTPHYQVVDCRRTKIKHGLCPELIQAITQNINANNQTIVFLNRRGFSPLILCHACGWTADCPHCDAKLTFHQQKNRLCCHHCGSERPLYSQCLQCHSDQLIKIGIGTERLEEHLSETFPGVEIIRIDQDTTRGGKNTLPKLIEKIQNGQRQILIGTQMLAKGHHFPNVTLVGLIDVDNALFSSDFRALERLGQLIVQVSGRAGREQKQGKVIIQTHNPEHPLLVELLTKGYQEFAKSLLQEREAIKLPPYSYLAVLQAESTKPHQLNDFLKQAKALGLKISASRSIKIIGPLPAPMGKKAGRHRSQLIIQAEQRLSLQHWLANWVKKLSAEKWAQRVRWVLDVDPQEL